MPDAWLEGAEGRGILAVQATLLKASSVMQARYFHPEREEVMAGKDEESGAEKAKDMREEGRGR